MKEEGRGWGEEGRGWGEEGRAGGGKEGRRGEGGREREQIVSDPQLQVVMKELLGAGLLHGDCLTVTGRTVAENLRDTPTISDLKSQVYSWKGERRQREREGGGRGMKKGGHSRVTPRISDLKNYYIWLNS